MKRSTYKNYLATWINHAERQFKNFEATVSVDDETIQIIDWKNTNDSSEYNMHIIFDKKKGHMYIDGDLGTAVFHFTENADINTISTYKSLSYFMEKMICSTNDYSYDVAIAREDLEENLLSDKMSESDKESAKALIEQILDDYDQYGDDVCLSNEYIGQIAEFDPDYFEWAYSIGKLPAARVIIWMKALQMIKANIEKKAYEHDIF